MDEIDFIILKRLMENSRVTFRELAELIGMSVSSTHKRINKLLDQDIIQRSKDKNSISNSSGSTISKKSAIIEKTITRMQCIACGELITDDKFITIRDPKGVIIYLHSKGKCSPRHDQLKIARERWLKLRQHGETISSSQEAEE